MESLKLPPRYKNSPRFRAYWEDGNGKDLIEWSAAEVRLTKFEAITHLYHNVDVLGDEVVTDFYQGKTYRVSNQTIEQLIRYGVPKDADLPQSVKELFEFSERVPEWLDEDLLKSGAEACMKTGLDALLSLRDYSLMGGYDYAY